MATSPREIEELLAHAPWVRALARSLVRDPARADDLVQQAWIAVLERPPAHKHALRRWLAAVLRNLARADRRAEARRLERERFAAARTPAAPEDGLGATLELSRRLAEALERLEEPYRSAIFRRYYEGLAPRRIAALEDVPLKTVKTRLARGLEKLRERLDREHDGDRGAWIAACLPLLRATPAPWALGGIVMNLKVVSLAAGVLLVGAWMVLRDPAPRPPSPSARVEREVPRAPGETDAPLQPAEREPGDARRAAAPASAAANGSTVPAATSVREISGRVVDPHGLGVAGVQIHFVSPPEAQSARRPGAGLAADPVQCASGPDGRFRWTAPARAGVLLGERAGFVTLLGSDVWGGDLQKEFLLVLAPSVDVAGVVVDEQGRPIAGADVRIVAGDGVRRELSLASDTAVEIPWSTRSDERGHFAFDAAPGVASAELRAFHPRHAGAVEPMPEVSRTDLRLVLPACEALVLAGEVLEPGGRPVEDAFVAMGQLATRTDVDGRFELELKDEMRSNGNGSFESTLSNCLGAIKPGRLPARVQEPPGGWPGFLTLVLGGEPLVIRGHVLDEHGAACVGVQVRATNEHRFGVVPSRVGNTAWTCSFEGLTRGEEGASSGVHTDGDGGFEVRGLLDEEYVLQAFDPRTLRGVRSTPLRAGGRDVELRFAPRAGLEHVAGRVLSLGGDPLAGVSVFPARRGLGDLPGDGTGLEFGTAQVSDAQGRFDFGALATEGLELQIVGDELQSVVAWKPPAGARLSELEVRTSRRCHLQVDLGDRTGLADSLVVLDEQGAPLQQWIHRGNTAQFGLSQPIRNGKSDVVAVPENAATIVLEKGGVEVQRRAVHVAPGALETVRF